MPTTALATVVRTDPTPEQQLAEIMSQIEKIRVTIREERGQGFLINAEKNIQCFLNIQQSRSTGKGDTK